MDINYEAMDDPETFVPHHMRGGYKRYYEYGISPGSFGQAILRGDVQGARMRADHINAHHIDSQIAWVKKYATAAPANDQSEDSNSSKAS